MFSILIILKYLFKINIPELVITNSLAWYASIGIFNMIDHIYHSIKNTDNILNLNSFLFSRGENAEI